MDSTRVGIVAVVAVAIVIVVIAVANMVFGLIESKWDDIKELGVIALAMGGMVSLGWGGLKVSGRG